MPVSNNWRLRARKKAVIASGGAAAPMPPTDEPYTSANHKHNWRRLRAPTGPTIVAPIQHDR
jgi:hypothetical protein